MDKREYPIKVVEIRSTDHRPPGGPKGGPPKLFGKVTDKTRKALVNQIAETQDHFQQYFELWPNLPAVAKVTLKEEALAKSHRPTALLMNKTCPIIGTLDFGEVLVSATPDGLSKLSKRITKSTSKKPVANISAIEKIEPYQLDNKYHALNERLLEKSAAEGRPLKIHTFDHDDQEINEQLKAALKEFAYGQGIELEEIHYGTRCSAFKVSKYTKSAGKALKDFAGIQSLTFMPSYMPADFNVQTTAVGSIDDSMLSPPIPDREYPVVGVIDSGVCQKSTALAPWVVAREDYVPRALQDNMHGTMVAGLIAGSKILNNQDDRFPEARAKILDVAVFEKNSQLQEDILVSIIEEVVPKYPNIKVWNLSLGSSQPTHPSEFSDFACFLDEMHDRYGCLFVIASGNHSHLQQWPGIRSTHGADRVSSPGDSIRAITVGSIANKHHSNSLSKTEEPSPFSRRGPGPCYIPKPEVSHYGGNCTAKKICAQTGILSVGPNNALCESVGTSFATPLVSSQAAVLWNYLQEQGGQCTPERVKALLIHSALLTTDAVTSETLNFYGFGKTQDVMESLYCNPNSITLMFETDLRHGGHEFERWPFPIADCLHNASRKFMGEILMTVAYSPITDRKYKSEYCRTNVDVGMGDYSVIEDEHGNKKREFQSVVPHAPKDLKKLFEKHQIENGFKWSPVKAYRAKFTGKEIETWRLRMKVSRRAELEMPETDQRATLLITFRSKNPEAPVYNEAVQTMTRSGWVTHDIDAQISVRT